MGDGLCGGSFEHMKGVGFGVGGNGSRLAPLHVQFWSVRSIPKHIAALVSRLYSLFFITIAGVSLGGSAFFTYLR